MVMDIDMRIVGSIVQDFSHKRIEIFNLYSERIWSNSYKNEQYFKKLFQQLSKRFSEELRRIESEMIPNNLEK